MKRNFLIVSANAQVRDALAGELKSKGYSVTLASSCSEARRVARNVSVEAALLETHLPDGSAEALRDAILQSRPDCRITVCTNFGLIRNTPAQLQFGKDDFLVPRERLTDLMIPGEVKEGLDATLMFRGYDALLQVVDVLVGLREVDDRYFGGSTHQVSKLAQAVTAELCADLEMVQEVTLATLLRDIGNAAHVQPPAPVDDEGDRPPQKKEKAKHVLAGVRMLEHIDFPWKVLPIIRHHHERYDGTGYPDGLRGREIPMGARIVSVVDAYVAMTSHREYREAMKPEAAMQELIRGAGHQFDPEVVEVFQRVLDKRLGMREGKSKPLVLIVDSDEDSRKLVAMRLMNEGYEVKSSVDTERGLEIVLKDAPDLVLVDVDADPEATFSLLQELREDPTLSRIPFVMMSQGGNRMVKLRALREGVDEFLSKKLDLEETVAHVENVVAREAIRKDGVQRKQRRGISGVLEQFSLPDLVQMVVIGMKTASISITAGKKTGKVWFDNGAPKHAHAGKKTGETAFYEMLLWKTGEFSIEHGVTAGKVTLDQDATFLLMEGLRQMDEALAPADSA